MIWVVPAKRPTGTALALGPAHWWPRERVRFLRAVAAHLRATLREAGL